MNIVNELPREYLDGSVLVFLDDVLIYSTRPEEKAEYLQILVKLRKHLSITKANGYDITKA